MAIQGPGGPIGTMASHTLDFDPVDGVFLFLTEYDSGSRMWAYRYGSATPATLSVDDATLPYADPIVFLFMGGFLIAIAMQKWDLHRRIALLTLRGVGTHPRRIVLGMMIATAFLSMWVSNTATTLMMLPIGLSVLTLVVERTRATTSGGTDVADRVAGGETVKLNPTAVGSKMRATVKRSVTSSRSASASELTSSSSSKAASRPMTAAQEITLCPSSPARSNLTRTQSRSPEGSDAVTSGEASQRPLPRSTCPCSARWPA